MSNTEDIVCMHCDKTMSSLSNLNRHQRTSKTCLRIQGKYIDKKTDKNRKEYQRKESEPCPGCNSVFARQRNLDTHLEVCPAYKKYLIDVEQERRVNVALVELRKSLEESHLREIKELHEEYRRKMDKKMEEVELEHLRTVELLSVDHEMIQGDLQEELASVKDELMSEKITHAVTKGKLEVQTESVRLAVQTPKVNFEAGAVSSVHNYKGAITNNTNNVLIAALTSDLGQRLAGRIGPEQFWKGQLGIAKELGFLRDLDGNKHYRVKDENRGKFEVFIDGKVMRDDGACLLIDNVKGPVIDKIGEISKEMTNANLRPEAITAILKQRLKVSSFCDPKKNRQFIQGLSS